jgi:glycosyltransferase involved in cell wall biosynthesis
MSRPLTVALLTPLPPPAGGIASWASDLLAGPLADRVEMIAVSRNPGALDRGPVRDGLARLGASLTGAAGAARVLVRERPDVLHVCVTGTAPGLVRDLALLEMARSLGIATVVHVHGAASQLGERGPLVAVAKVALRRAGAVVVLNEPSRAYLRGIGVERLHLIPNAVPERPAPGRRSRAPGDPLRVVFVGWLKPAKGVIDMLDAAAAIPAVHLTLLGRFVAEGGATCEADVRARLASPELADRASWVGEVPRAEVGRYLDEADLFCLPSHGEGLPVALLEAMMAALPCVVTDVGGMPEAVVDGGCGAVVPARDPGALREALAAYVADPDLARRHGAAARARAVERYGAQVVHGRLEALWRDLAARRSTT